MARPKHLYEIDANEFILRADSGQSAVLQQANVLGRRRGEDSLIFIDRDDAVKLRDALDQWLKETAS